MTNKTREMLRKFFERHPRPPWLDGGKTKDYYPQEDKR